MIRIDVERMLAMARRSHLDCPLPGSLNDEVSPQELEDLCNLALKGLNAEFPKASKEDAKLGWAFDSNFLDRIQQDVGCDEDCGPVQLEEIQAVLIAATQIAALDGGKGGK